MNPLYLSGFNVFLGVDRARLQVRDGIRAPDVEPQRFEIQPRNAHFDSVIIDGHSGSLSLDAMKWLMRYNIPIFVLDYNGTLLSSTLPREPVNGPLKIAQVEAYEDSRKRFYIAKKLIEAKAQRTLDTMKWLELRYGKSDKKKIELDHELERLEKSGDLRNLMMVEGRIADVYWRYLQHILPSKFGFVSRIRETHQRNASDPVNCLLNYGYAILESECRKALNSVGLDPTIGFLHEPRQVKSALVYDFQEPFRWLVDTTVVSCLESRYFGKKNFFRTDDYVLRLRPEAMRKLIDTLRPRFNSTVSYKGKNYSWDTVIQMKAQELANYIQEKRKEVNFDQPSPVLLRDDLQAIRNYILSLTTAEARKHGVGKSTLHDLRKHARNPEPFRVYKKVANRLARSRR